MARMAEFHIWVTLAQFLLCFIVLFYTKPYYQTITTVDYAPSVGMKYSDRFLSGLDKDYNLKFVPESSNATDDLFNLKGIPHDQELNEILMQDDRSSFNISNDPVIRVQHMVPANQGQDRCEVFGKGLHYAKVGVIANLTIKVNETCTNGQELNKTSIFSVLGVGTNHIFVAYPSLQQKGSSDLNFSYLPTYPGEYDLYVEDVVFQGQWQVPGSPFRLKVDGAQDNTSSQILPSCQTLRLPRQDLSWVSGDWVTRKLTRNGEDLLRSGWVHQPKICNFDIFRRDEILMAAESPTPKTIAVLGTSTERGIFLSLVDLTLKKEDKTNIRYSDLGRCWGIAELRVGKLTYIYQDFRIDRLNSTFIRNQKSLLVTCHNEKRAEESFTLWEDALTFISGFLFGLDRVWPDIILIPMRSKMQLSLIFKAIPKSWNGTFYILSGFKTYFTPQFTARGRQLEIKKAMEYPAFDPRVQVLDAFVLATGMRHAGEKSPLVMGSEHWHRWCNELAGEMQVCGNPTEMVAQLLLGKVIAPEGKKAWLKSVKSRSFQINPNSPAGIETSVCYDCPKTLLPFHIKKQPDLKCYKVTNGLRKRSEKNVRVWDGSLCPAECMKTSPVGKAHTQSGMVDVRQCEMPI